VAWDLRLELFVDDLDVFAGFYPRVLGFTVVDRLPPP
jgi:catechol 2,3-dioxygenase-like lactoylglutathione lyase family enzyme